MKSLKKLLQKAMVFTLTAAMLVGTPLTASAAGLVDLYKVVDNFGEDYGEHDPDNSNTGTVTNTTTDTNSSVLNVDATEIAGIMIKEPDIELDLEANKEATLHVAFVNAEGEEITPELDDKTLNSLKKRFIWKSGNNNIVALVPNKTGMTDEMGIRAKAGGRTTITVELQDYTHDIYYKDSINVSVEQWAKDIVIDNELLQKEAIGGDSLTLDDYVNLVPATANDEITYAIVSGGSNATLKNGVLKLKKYDKNKPKTFQIIAMGKKASKKSAVITILEQRPTKTYTFETVKDGEKGKGTWTNKNKNYAWIINADSHKLEFEATLMDKDGKISTDRIVSWTSKKPDIVKVGKISGTDSPRNGCRVELNIADKIDKAQKVQITAKTSSGKSCTLTVDIKAYLSGLKNQENQGEESKTVYSGQTVELNVDRLFAKEGKTNFTVADDLNWEIVNAKDKDGKALTAKEAGKVAKIKKSILTITPSITFGKGSNAKTVKNFEIAVSNKKEIAKNVGGYYKGKNDVKIDKNIKITLEQIDIRSITIYKNTLNSGDALVKSAWEGTSLKNKTTDKTKTTTLPVDNTRTFGVVATIFDKDGKETSVLENGEPVATALGWTVNNAKLAKVTKGDRFGRVTAIKKGKPNIVISGSTADKNGKYKTIKATVKLNVTQPTKTLALTASKKDIPLTKGTVTIKATVDKGTSTKDIKWSLTVMNKDGRTVKTPARPLASGKIAFANADTKNSQGLYTKLALPTADSIGDIYVVKASVPQSGISRSIRMKLVTKSNKVTINEVKEGDTKLEPVSKKYNLTLSADDENPKAYVLTPYINDAELKANDATVTYTVNKPGYVYISGNTVKTLQETSAAGIKITPVSSDGKKGTAITVVIKKAESN